MTTQQERPANVPAEAVWEDDGWTAGSKDAQGRKIGAWSCWSASGELNCVEEWGDGIERLTYRRFHPDGSESQRGAKDLKKGVWVGVMRWAKLAAPSPEDRYWDTSLDEAVRALEFEFDDEGYVFTERHLDAEGRPIARDGSPLPPRPATVSAEAIYIPDERVWLQHRRALGTDALLGERRVWDRNGTLKERSLHEPAGQWREHHEYDDGRLWMSKHWQADGSMIQSFYHRGVEPPAVRSATLYLHEGKDRTQTFYDAQGQRIYSVRMEVVGPHHERRYWDDTLVFEAIGPEDPAQPPSKVEYYDLQGAVIVSYASSGGGEGVWTLHDARGAAELTLPADDEASRNEYDNWDCFLPGFAHYDAETTADDPTTVRAAFREAYAEEVTAAALARMEPPPGLAEALGPGSWKKLETAYGDARELPRYVLGVLSDDEAVARYSLERIWPQIEHQGSVYPATHRVGTALARMLPLQAERPAVERRVLEFLVAVLQLPHLLADAEEREAWAAALRPSIARLQALAFGDDEELARMGLYALAHAGVGERAVIEVFTRTLRESTTPVERARGALGLNMTATAKAAKAAFEGAFAAEGDPMVRFLLALLLLSRSRRAEPAWISAIERHAIDGSEIAEAFAELAPFLEASPEELAREMLPAEALERHMEPLIEELRAQDMLTQIDTLRALCRVLFPEGAPERLSELQRRALRACADVVDAHPGFVNHAEVFRAYDLPHDSFELRQLAEGAAPEEEDAEQAVRSGAKKPGKTVTRTKSGAKKSGETATGKKAGAKKSGKTGAKKAGAKKSGKSGAKTAGKKAAKKTGAKTAGKKAAKKSGKTGAKKSGEKTGAKKATAKKAGKKATRSTAKRPGTKAIGKKAAKKSGAKKTAKSGAKKSGAKKSAKSGAKKTAKSGAKKSGAKKSAKSGAKKTAKSATKVRTRKTAARKTAK